MRKMSCINKKILIGLCVLVFGMIMNYPNPTTAAATAIKIQSVDYYNENIIVINGTNQKIYYADEAGAAKNDWDVIPVDNGTTTSIDISYMLAAVDNTVLIKGDVDTGIARITVKHKPTKLNITINYSYMDQLNSTDTIATLVNIMSTEGDGKNPINFSNLEWKKNATGAWTNSQYLTVDKMEKFLVRGTYLYFRIKAVNDVTSGTYYPNGAKGRRFSDEVKLRIEKKAPAVVSGIDGSKMKADIKVGKEYRVTATYADGTVATSSGWMKVMSKTDAPVSLVTIANDVSPRYSVNGKVVDFDGEKVGFPQLKLEVRSYATSKSAPSKITETLLNPQRVISTTIKSGAPSATALANGTEDVYVNYNGVQNIEIYAPAASVDMPYEYCVFKKGDKFSFDKALWTTITKGTAIKVLSSKAIDGGTLYVRKKEIKYKPSTPSTDAIAYALASTYASTTLNYPSAPSVTKTNLVYTKGYSTPLKIMVKLNESGKEAFETSLKGIKLGTKDIRFTTAVGAQIDDPTVSIMTITLNEDDIKSIGNCSNRPLTITFSKGSVDKTSVLLTITTPTPAATLNATVAKGTAAGTTKITLTGTAGAGNIWVYEIGTTAVSGKNTADILPTTVNKNFTSGSNITVTAGQYITIYEINASRNIIKYKSIQIGAGQIM